MSGETVEKSDGQLLIVKENVVLGNWRLVLKNTVVVKGNT